MDWFIGSMLVLAALPGLAALVALGLVVRHLRTEARERARNGAVDERPRQPSRYAPYSESAAMPDIRSRMSYSVEPDGTIVYQDGFRVTPEELNEIRRAEAARTPS